MSAIGSFVLNAWKIFVVLFILVTVILGSLFGVVFYQAFGFASLGIYGFVVIVRKIWQLAFARLNNRRMRYIVRQPLINELIKVYPNLAKKAEHLLDKSLQFDQFKAEALKLIISSYTQRALDETEIVGMGQLPPNVRQQLWADREWRYVVIRSFDKTYTLPPYPGQAERDRLLMEYQDVLGYVRDQAGLEKAVDAMLAEMQANWLKAYDSLQMPTVGIVVPIYRTRVIELKRLVESIENQTYPISFVELVLNDPEDDELKAMLVGLVTRYGDKYHWRVEPRLGKRYAMRTGFDNLLESAYFRLSKQVKYVFNVDSDSELHEDAISNAVRVFESDSRIDCLTGDIRVSNHDVNLLTVLTYQRYFFAFNVERAAQSLWQGVTCMSGPFMGIRAAALAHILEPWATQVFMGNQCNFGDDRHISTLVLKSGRASVFTPDSIAWTDVPETMKTWRRQQTRWNRSAWRETIITLPWIYRLPLWVILDTAYLSLFPFILWGIVIWLTIKVLSTWLDKGLMAMLEVILPYAVVVLALNFLFNALYGALVNRDARYLYNPLYIVYQFLWLQPIRVWALLTVNRTEWGTR